MNKENFKSLEEIRIEAKKLLMTTEEYLYRISVSATMEVFELKDKIDKIKEIIG